MKISELQGLLTKIQQVTGDAEVVLKAAETEAETVLQSVGVELGASDGTATGSVTITHGSETSAPVDAPPAETAPADPPAPAV